LSPEFIIEQYGAWGIIAFLSYMLLKFVLVDLRSDQKTNTEDLLREHDKQYVLISKVHERLDKNAQKMEKVLSIIERMNSK